jgi:hypothetical protein
MTVRFSLSAFTAVLSSVASGDRISNFELKYAWEELF